MADIDEVLSRNGLTAPTVEQLKRALDGDYHSHSLSRRTAATILDLLDEAACVIEDTEDGQPLESLNDARAILAEVLR